MKNLKLISIFCIIFAVSVMIGCGKDNNKTSDNGEIFQTTEVVPENIMKKFRRDIDKGGIGGGGFGGEWGLSEYRECIKGENGKIYGLATKSKNVELWTAIMEVDVEHNRLRFLEMWYDKMTYSALHKLSDDKFDKSWQSSNDASNPVNRYCAYLKQHYDEIPALDKNKKYYSNDLEEAVDMVKEIKEEKEKKEKNAASFDPTRNDNKTNPKLSEDIESNKHWIKDSNTGIYLWNPEPTEGESVSWSGGYIENGKYKYADGKGTLTWYKNGKIIQVDNGTFICGRHHGRFIHKFPSGKEMYSNWNNGVEIKN